MFSTNDFQWLENYLLDDTLWSDNAVNWDLTVDLVLMEYSLYSFLVSPFFKGTYISLSTITKMSSFDAMFLQENDPSSSDLELFELMMWDFSSYISNNFLPLQVIFYTDYQNFPALILQNSPELTLALNEYVDTYWTDGVARYVPAVVFDYVNDANSDRLSDWLDHLTVFLIFTWVVILSTGVMRLAKWDNSLESYAVRFYNYLFALSRTSRLQFEATIQAFFIFLLYLSFALTTFDGDFEETLEFFNLMTFYFFVVLFVYFLYKYSIHFFSFLEAAVSEGRTLKAVTTQFFKDALNTVAFTVRLFVLVIRLNIYDTIDDFLDSYYIFVGDFDDDGYTFNLFYNVTGWTSISIDQKDDMSNLNATSYDIWNDLFYAYFIVWGQFTFFIFFILEEILRIAFALYVTYLIIFEVNALNRSYTEDTYFSTKRIIFKNSSSFSRL